jgi:uncharacterized protein YcfJ
MKISKLVTALVLGAAMTATAADFVDTAPVVGVEPIFSTQNRQECHFEGGGSDQQQGRAYSGAAVGAVAGGLAGNQIGGGNGKTAATALGAVIGALTGDRVQNDGAGQQQGRRVCTNQPTQVISGYRVRYSYQGREGVTTMRQQPGETVRVGVTAIQN